MLHLCTKPGHQYWSTPELKDVVAPYLHSYTALNLTACLGHITASGSVNIGQTVSVNNDRFQLVDGENLILQSDASLSVSGNAAIGPALNVDNGRLNVIDGGNVSIHAMHISDMNSQAKLY